jgi:hypothetical protein
VAVAALVMFEGLVVAGPMDVDVLLSFNAQVINRPTETPGYHIFPSASVTGLFSDPDHPGNLTRLDGPDGSFAFEASGTGGFSSSVVFDSVATLRAATPASSVWTLTITDGATNTVYEYEFTVDASALVDDHMRPITLVGIALGDTIPGTPAFHWTIPPSGTPGVEYLDAFAFLIGPGFTFEPLTPVTPASTSTSATATLAPGTYRFEVQFQTYPTTDVLVPGVPVPVGGAPAITVFNFENAYSSYVAVNNLFVAGCDAIDFNGDGVFPDNQDLVDYIEVFAGAPCPTGTCNDIDFNNDGVFPDNADLVKIIEVFAGAPC